MDVGELLVEFAHARLHVGYVVRKTLHLRAHGVEARAGRSREILRGLLNGGHGGIEFIDGVQRLLNERALHRGVLGHLRLQVVLALNQLGDAVLQVDDLSRNGISRSGAEQSTAQRSREHRRTEEQDPSNTQGVPPPRGELLVATQEFSGARRPEQLASKPRIFRLLV